MYIQYNLILTIFLYFLFLLFSKRKFFIHNRYTRRFESENYRMYFLIIMAFMVFVRSFVLPSSVSDIINYQRALIETSITPWDKIATIDSGVRIEFGYRIILKLFSYISIEINNFLFLQAIVSQVLLFRILSKYSAGPFVSLIIYNIVMFCPSIYILRQYLAMLICYNGIQFVLERKCLPFLLIIFISFSIHLIAIVFLPLYFIYGIKTRVGLIVTHMCIFAILSVSFSYLYSYFGGNVFDGYDTYLYTNKYEGSNKTESMIALSYLIPFIFFARNNIFKPGMDKVLFISMLLGFSISFTGTSLPLIGRLSLFYTFSVIFMIPRIMSYMKSSFVRYIFEVIVLIMMYIVFFHDENMSTYQLMF